MGQFEAEMGQLEHAGRGGAAPYRTPAALSECPSVNQATPPRVGMTSTDGLRVTQGHPSHPINGGCCG